MCVQCDAVAGGEQDFGTLPCSPLTLLRVSQRGRGGGARHKDLWSTHTHKPVLNIIFNRINKISWGIFLLFSSNSVGLKAQEKEIHHIQLKFFFSSLLNNSAHSWDSGSGSQSPFDHFMAVGEFGVPWSMGPSWSYYDNWDTSTSDSTNGERFQWSRAHVWL